MSSSDIPDYNELYMHEDTYYAKIQDIEGDDLICSFNLNICHFNKVYFLIIG